MTERWIDRLSLSLVLGASRRQAVGLAALLAAGLTRGGALETEAGKKNRRKGKGKQGNKKRQSQKRPGHLAPPDGEDDCEAYLDAELWSGCREIRRTCHAPDHFCIHAVDDPVGDGQGVSCCTSPKICCIDGCLDPRQDPYNCGGCGVVCPPGQYCIEGTCRCEDGFTYCDDVGLCIREGNACCGILEYEGCHPTFPCCGSGSSAYCGQFGYCH